MNNLIIKEFETLIKLIELENNITESSEIYNINLFRIASFKKTIKKLKEMKEIRNIEMIKGIKGIGKGTIDRIKEILEKGFLEENRQLELKYKSYHNINNLIEELEGIIGIGKKNAISIITKYQIKSLSEFIEKVNNNEININDKIKLGVEYYGKYEMKIKRDIITDIYNYILNNNNDSKLNITICGSYRRNTPFSSDIDILLVHSNIKKFKELNSCNVLNDFINHLKHLNIIIKDITSSNVKKKYMGFCKWNNIIYRIDIRFVPIKSFIPALIYFTGSKTFNKIMRNEAKKLNYKLNEYGLYKNNKFIKIISERHLFKILKMDYLEPHER